MPLDQIWPPLVRYVPSKVTPRLTGGEGAIFCPPPLRFSAISSEVMSGSSPNFQYPPSNQFDILTKQTFLGSDTSAMNDVRVTLCFPGVVRNKGLQETCHANILKDRTD